MAVVVAAGASAVVALLLARLRFAADVLMVEESVCELDSIGSVEQNTNSGGGGTVGRPLTVGSQTGVLVDRRHWVTQRTSACQLRLHQVEAGSAKAPEEEEEEAALRGAAVAGAGVGERPALASRPALGTNSTPPPPQPLPHRASDRLRSLYPSASNSQTSNGSVAAGTGQHQQRRQATRLIVHNVLT